MFNASPPAVPRMGQHKRTVITTSLSMLLHSCLHSSSHIPLINSENRLLMLIPLKSYLPPFLIWHQQSHCHQQLTAPHQEGDVDGGAALKAGGVYEMFCGLHEIPYEVYEILLGSVNCPVGSMECPLGLRPCSLPRRLPPCALFTPPRGADGYFSPAACFWARSCLRRWKLK